MTPKLGEVWRPRWGKNHEWDIVVLGLTENSVTVAWCNRYMDPRMQRLAVFVMRLHEMDALVLVRGVS